jgi:uncharacterized protein (TIGR02246 family)
MSKLRRILAAALAALAALAVLGWWYRSAAQDRSDPEAEVRKTGQEFVTAFNKGDARAVAALWTKDAEYTGPDGEVLRGRDAIEKDYAAFFKKNPKAVLQVHIDSVRLLGRHTALEEGRLQLKLAGDREPSASRYSVLHVHEEDGWRMASVHEWAPNPAQEVALKDVEWLVGDWAAKSDEGELTISYAWDEDRAFLRGRYTLKKDGKVFSSGTQMIGKDPSGGLRSWLFDRSGTYGESAWTRDGQRWVLEAAGTLPDGSTVTAVNLLVPLGKDAFTWQSVERTAVGTALPDTVPLKVTRVKADR